MKSLRNILVFGAVSGVLAACSSNDSPATGAGTGGSPSNGTGGSPSASGTGGSSATGGSGGSPSTGDAASATDAPAGPVAYALSVLVFNADDTTTTFVSIFNSLDITSVDNSKGYEFPGASDIAAYDGHLFVSSGEAPTITRFSLDSAGKLTQDGVVSFSNFGVDTVSVGAAINTFISPTKAYIFGGDGTHVIWNPTTMEITGTIAVPNMVRDGFVLDGSSGIVRGNRMYRALYWEDWSTYTFSDDQNIITFDTEHDTLLSVVPETRCPNLGALAEADESGNVYLSNWFYNVTGTLIHNKKKSCVLRIPPGTDTVDPNWSLTFSDVTGGHEGAQLSYIKNQKAVFAAFREEGMTINGDTEPFSIPSAVSWEAWGVDLGTKVGAPISGIDKMVADQTVFTLDGRTFLLAPGTDWNTTKAYEIAANGTARLAFSIDGWSRGFVKIK